MATMARTKPQKAPVEKLPRAAAMAIKEGMLKTALEGEEENMGMGVGVKRKVPVRPKVP